MTDSFKAFVVDEDSEGTISQSVRDWPIDKLPDHEVLVRVHYSSLNYKDALSATGNKGVTKTYPHVPGIDAAGIIESPGDSTFDEGDKVLVTGYDLGQNTFGGFGQYIRVPANWIVPLPDNLSLRDSMIIGTAGFTASIGVHHLRHNNITPDDGSILVTGGTGGVGTMAVSILSALDYKVTAATGKLDQSSFLKNLGAASVIHRDEVQDESSKPLLSSRWAGVIDTVGGIMLDTALRQTQHNGTVACCGNVLGHELHTNVYPFILRGINLAGMDSGNCLMELRKKLWNKLASSWKPQNLESLSHECSLESIQEEITKILEGQQVGRVLVKLPD
ncbi:putative quinone oxidoreductase, YhdH/YhfP family [Fodinibius salinus]|uniref:Putative quinone oxidoreductase, YhdH/YhfP family n=1 Tax=Fodinibius salinus TaxID=860790 RepID=A0A5D3YK11_9BACT|nr:YhdH/YhfP family quinone oxidoreductase [Fodinibius salinus]TYP93892.1 putative quinone oxidoreductase, YhdH/YhfP family [Fodinibius salinus]